MVAASISCLRAVSTGPRLALGSALASVSRFSKAAPAAVASAAASRVTAGPCIPSREDVSAARHRRVRAYGLEPMHVQRLEETGKTAPPRTACRKERLRTAALELRARLLASSPPCRHATAHGPALASRLASHIASRLPLYLNTHAVHWTLE